jgi:hypothetical protein
VRSGGGGREQARPPRIRRVQKLVVGRGDRECLAGHERAAGATRRHRAAKHRRLPVPTQLPSLLFASEIWQDVQQCLGMTPESTDFTFLSVRSRLCINEPRMWEMFIPTGFFERSHAQRCWRCCKGRFDSSMGNVVDTWRGVDGELWCAPFVLRCGLRRPRSHQD